MQTKQQNEEVLYVDEQIVRVQRSDVEFMKQKARSNERQRIRLCAHKDINDRLHEMLIIHSKNTYVRPHKHLNKSESFHVIEGVVDVILFDERGGIIRVIHMGPYGSDLSFYYRLSEPLYHTLLIRSEVFVFHETTNGPFDRSETLFAPWAPEERDESAVKDFIDRIEHKLQDLLPAN